MQLDTDKISKGDTVWYHYPISTNTNTGPFKVLGFHSNHEGRHIQLDQDGQVRNVSLADDEDYGLPLFYDSEPPA
jgi:hypothetical protein